MKGDISRHTFRPEKHYSGVRQQQGRVQLDADWNEQVDIQSHLDRTTRRDVIGLCCVPAATPDGFRIGEARDAAAGPARDLSIGLGRIYVDGMLCEHEANLASITVVEQSADKVLTQFAELPALALDGRDFEVGQWAELLVGGQPQPRQIETVVHEFRRLSFSNSIGKDSQQLRRLLTYLTQPDYPNAEIHDGVKNISGNWVSGQYLVYLDVWQRHITAVEDPSIREVALGGPDTATRAMTVCQVKLFRAGGANNIVHCNGEFPDWQAQIAPSTGKLSARARPVEPPEDECSLPPTAGYSGLEHQTYRVEIHHGSDHADGPTFKWSRDNGSLTYPIDDFVTAGGVTNGVQVAHLGRDEPTALREGDWVELSDEDTELSGKPALLTKIEKIDRPDRFVTLQDAFNALDAGGNPRRFPKLRRWDMKDDEIQPAGEAADNDGFVKLENGVEVRFTAGSYRTGDYWIIPARSAASGATAAEVEWPRDAAGNPVAESPLGIHHHYCRLAIVSVVNNDGVAQFAVIDDCRKIFEPLGVTADEDTLFQVEGVSIASDSQQVLANDSTIFADLLKEGINVKCSENVSATAVEDNPVCSVTLEIPHTANSQQGNLIIGYQPLTLGANLTVEGSKIRWRPDELVKSWLDATVGIGAIFDLLARQELPPRILAHLTLGGNFIWADGAPQRLLDGDTFGAPADGSRTQLQLPSGDRRNGGDFRMWFWLVERITVISVTFDEPKITGGDPVNGTVTLSGKAPMDIDVTLVPSKSSVVASFNPDPVTVGRDQLTARFTMSTNVVDSTQQLSVHGAIDGPLQGAAGDLTVFPPINSVSVRNTVLGGRPLVVEVSLHLPASDAKVKMFVSNNGRDLIRDLHDQTLTINEESSTTHTVKTWPTTRRVSGVKIRGTRRGVSREDSVDILPVSLKAVELRLPDTRFDWSKSVRIPPPEQDNVVVEGRVVLDEATGVPVPVAISPKPPEGSENFVSTEPEGNVVAGVNSVAALFEVLVMPGFPKPIGADAEIKVTASLGDSTQEATIQVAEAPL